MGNAATKLSPDDIIIAVVGQTGSGKSTFINTAARTSTLPINHGLRPDAQSVRHIECLNCPNHGKVVLVDTPAFDSESDEKNVEKKLESWLKSVSSKKLAVRISGILYLHRITDDRLSDPPLRHLTLLKELCEVSIKGFPNRVVLVTTMWKNMKSQEVAKQREQELQKYWNGIPHGSIVSQTMRFGDSYESAWSIVDTLMGKSTP
ncbi:hypothetical protein P691DRAFT_794062 [Macrolepiota fuliginosa MF-IS2]|uniref:G domain-containing protein n=1 Tax=Macrolepiota fuliginosa MF-IS2 TaxID=1400762 RepID=A0A9P6C2T6_9AGAR|nr:hypothetical protein P691DRAFT_794062 [Macrolepiota fuliginosa MF-IS2]